jgi:O-antigen/teichoic acid export membrane protein
LSKIKGFIGETFIYGFANVFSRVFAMLLIPFYVANLGKIEYSNLVLVQSVFSILTFILALNSGVFFYYYEWAKEKYRKMIFSSWFYYQIAIALFLGVILFLFAKPASNLLVITNENQESLITTVQLIGLLFIPYILNITNINLFRIDRKPKKVVLIVFFEALFTAVIVILGLSYFNFGIVEVIISQIVGRSIVSLFFIKTISTYFHWKYFSFKILRKLLHFSWPFFIISDKFIGADVLVDKEDMAILAFAFQITLPITILADMIRMAIGPFVMSIKSDKDADKTYQKVYDLSVFSGIIVLVFLIAFTPLITRILADSTYLKVIQVIPLIGLASILSLIANQFAISFSLVKKNVFILIATVIAGIIVTIINLTYMKSYGFVISGISQAISTFIMAGILFILGKKHTDLKIELKNSIIYLIVLGGYITSVYFYMDQILSSNYSHLIIVSSITLAILAFSFLFTQKKAIND